MPRTETVVRTFRNGPKIPTSLVQVGREMLAGSENTAQQKQQANEDYFNAVKKVNSREEDPITSTKP